jgi:hypothetical protein
VGVTGNIRFGGDSGVSIGRFDQLRTAARALVNTVPAICVFFKPRMSGTRYSKELPGRVVVTWILTEPAGNIQDVTWTPTVNRFQTVLRRDGTVEMSYEQVAAREALGDKFDFLAYYSDFRIDNQEAGTPRTGPVGGGVTGIGQNQWGFVQPVYAGSVQMQERPPAGIPDTNSRNIAFYTKQLGERAPDGQMPPTTTAWRRSPTRWATAGRPSFPPRSTVRPSASARPTGLAVSTRPWPSRTNARPRPRPWAAASGRTT